MTRPAPELLTAAEVAARTGIAHRTVNEWAKKGHFPGAFRTPGAGAGATGHWRIPAAAVDAALTAAWLTTAQVAELFRVYRQTVINWAEDGRLPCVKTVRGHRRYPEAEVRALIEAKKEP